MNQPSPIRAEARALLENGITPIPIGEGKTPPIAWKRYQLQPPTRAEVDAWFTLNPSWGLGAITGRTSGGLIMVELEGRAAHLLPQLAGTAARMGLADEWEALTHGWAEESPSGGLHYHMRTTGTAPRNLKLARRPTTPQEQDANPGQTITVLAETRGEGGLTVVAPTPGRLHPTGRPWKRLTGGPHQVPAFPPDTVDRLLDVFRALDQTPAPPAPTPRTTTPAPAAAGGETPGDAFERTTTWADILTPHGWTPTGPPDPNGEQHWRRPGKQGPGISATTGHAGDRDRLYVFTTSTPFTPETPYTKFGAHALLNHAGDHTAAARALAHAGYGTRPPAAVIDLPATPSATAAAVGGADPAARPDPAPRLHVVEYTEDHNATHFIDTHHERVRYITDQGRWALYENGAWRTCPANHGPVKHLARLLARTYKRDDEDSALRAWRRKSLSNRGLDNTLAIAATDPRTTLTAADFDTRPSLLNTPTGTIDLTTGRLRPHDPTELHSKQTPTTPDPHHPTPMWTRFLGETLQADPHLTTYMQTLAGYSATGDTGAQILPFLHGTGANGKSVLADVLTALLGDYATTAPPAFLQTGPDQHPTEIARLQGMRLVIANEVEDQAAFDETRIKQLTGGDALTARYMRGDFFTFHPTHTLWVLGNHQPRIRAGGHSLWRRMRLIPFTHQVPENQRIDNLAARLVDEEGPGILHWIVQGAVRYYQEGLATPQSVRAATSDYEAGEDLVGRFVEDRVIIGGGQLARVPYTDMRAAYTAWCAAEGTRPLPMRTLVRELVARGLQTVKSNSVRYLANATLAADPTTPDTDSGAWMDLGGHR